MKRAPQVGTVSDAELLRPEAVARMLGVSTKTLARLPIKKLRLGPRIVRYRADWLRDYIERQAA